MKNIKQFALTDTGNADRLVHNFGDGLRYVTGINDWYVYERGVWRRDKGRLVVEHAKRVTEKIAGEVQAIPDDLPSKELAAAEKALAGWAHTSQSVERLGAMVKLARSKRSVVISPDALDTHHHLLNVANGTFDLRQKKRVTHRPEDLLTKCAFARADPKAACPTWERFLERALPDRLVRDFVQRAAGYALTGDTGEHCFFLLYGTGRNGKSTFLKVLQHVLGDYAKGVRIDTFLMQRYDNTYYDLATLFGARFVWAAEPPLKGRLNEALLKSITGGDPVQARFLYKDFFEYVPTYKIFLAANNKPRVTEANEGFWSRVRLIPFEVQIPEAERDSRLFDKLVDERDGILGWMIRGYMAYQRVGLDPPQAVMTATNEYRAESDALGQFLAECTEEEEGVRTPRKKLYEAWRRWCEDNGESAGTQTEFTKRINERGDFHHTKYNGTNCWRDLSVKSPPRRGLA